MLDGAYFEDRVASVSQTTFKCGLTFGQGLSPKNTPSLRNFGFLSTHLYILFAHLCTYLTTHLVTHLPTQQSTRRPTYSPTYS